MKDINVVITVLDENGRELTKFQYSITGTEFVSTNWPKVVMDYKKMYMRALSININFEFLAGALE